MKTVYDMSSGQVVKTVTTTDSTAQLPYAYELPALQLMPVVSDSRPESPFPPELAMADLNAFVDEMS
jgi:hypothetical protein